MDRPRSGRPKKAASPPVGTEPRPEAKGRVVDVAVRSRARVAPARRLRFLARAAAETVLDRRGVEQAQVSVVFLDDPAMIRLNRQYRGREGTTDVLSFAMREGPAPDGLDVVLGDVVVSVEQARRQAREAGHDIEREIVLLLVHGLLHLLGFEHEGGGHEAARMRTVERGCLRAALERIEREARSALAGRMAPFMGRQARKPHHR